MSKQHEKPRPAESAETEKPAEALPADGTSQESPAADVGTAPCADDTETILDLKARIASLEAENANCKDQYLRKAADFENYRKRMNKEKQDAIDFANQSLLLDLIPVIDDFERAIKSSESARNYDTLHEGIALIEKRMVSQLESKWGLVRFESAGKPFDPNRHEAIMMDKSADVAEAVVAEDFVRGYELKDRVIRSAKVKVLMPAEQSPSSEMTNGGQS